MRHRNTICGLTCCLLLSFATATFAQDSKTNTPSLEPAEHGRVSIPLTGFGRDYLMSMSIIPQDLAATSTGLASRVIVFEMFDEEVDMYESTSGLVVTNDLPARRLLATFPITERTDDRITIDFNQGMRRVFTTIWYGSTRSNQINLSRVLEVPQSRVFSIEDKDGKLAIRQAVQARSRSSQQDLEQRLEIRYFLSPYAPGDFAKKENDRLSRRYVRFFETPSTVELTSGRRVGHIARFDLEKPITFYYSANTPEEYVDAVRGGVLYWNRAFDREFLRCEKAPEGVTAPSADHNIVQWVPWDSAGFAYADVLIDPLTGQSMHGQAYMTSVFAIGGVQRARILLRQMKLLEAKKEKKADKDDGDDDKEVEPGMSARLLGLPLFRTTASCDCDMAEFAEQYAHGLEALLESGEATDGAILRASQDYVRHVTAHEVGHVIGLRHNFAGSIAANVSPKALDEWFQAYITQEKDPETKEQYTTTSVMEYSVFTSAVFSGCRMRTTAEILPHDRAAIRWGYFNEQTVKEKKMLFATDDDVGTWADVQRFDYGAEPVVGAMADMGRILNGLSRSVIEAFIAAKAPRDKRDIIPLEQVNLSASGPAAAFVRYYREAFRWFNSRTRSLKIERNFDFVSAINEEERHRAHWESLQAQVKKVGGMDRLGFGFLPLKLSLDLKPAVEDAVPPRKFDQSQLLKQLDELLESDSYKTFVGADGKKHSFTEDETKIIRARAKLIFAKMETELLTRIMKAWATLPRDLGSKVNGQVSDDDIVAKFEKQIVAAAKLVILARDEKSGKRIRGKVDKSYVEVVDFTYDFDTRLAAAQALADRAGSYPAWSKEARASIGKELKNLIDTSLNIQNFKSFSDAKLSRPLRDWYLVQQNLLKALPK